MAVCLQDFSFSLACIVFYRLTEREPRITATKAKRGNVSVHWRKPRNYIETLTKTNKLEGVLTIKKGGQK